MTDKVVNYYLGEDGIWYVVLLQENGNTYTIERDEYLKISAEDKC